MTAFIRRPGRCASLSSSRSGALLKKSVMNNNMNSYGRLRSHRRQMRLMGIGLSIVGIFMLYSMAPVLINSESTISCNGVATTSIACKLVALITYLIFLTGGLVSLFASKKWLNRTAIWQARIANILRDKANGS